MSKRLELGVVEIDNKYVYDSKFWVVSVSKQTHFGSEFSSGSDSVFRFNKFWLVSGDIDSRVNKFQVRCSVDHNISPVVITNESYLDMLRDVVAEYNRFFANKEEEYYKVSVMK